MLSEEIPQAPSAFPHPLSPATLPYSGECLKERFRSPPPNGNKSGTALPENEPYHPLPDDRTILDG